MSYREFVPTPDLDEIVACTWERRAPRTGDGPPTRVVPDACVDLIWRGDELLVAGPDRGPFLSPVPAGTTVSGVRIRTGLAGLVLGLPAGELRDARVGIEDVWGRGGGELRERIGAASPAERRGALETAVRARLAGAPDPDPLTLAATRALGLPRTRVGELSFRLGISERQLRRRFHEAVGYGPKTLDRVLRFQRFLANAAGLVDGSEQLARIAAALGYADQAHLSRECLALSGLTPTALIDSRRPAPGAMPLAA